MMNAAAPPQADTEQIGRFVRALLRYADDGTFVSLRAFYENANDVFAIRAHQLSSDLMPLVGAAADLATRSARAERPHHSKADREQHPVGRVGKPEDIAEACLFLAERAGFITGQNLVVDGGMTVKMIYAE